MSTARRVLRNPKAILLLYVQETSVFVALFILMAVYLRAMAGDSYYAWEMDPSFLIKVFGNPGVWGMIGVITLFFAAMFIGLRLFLMGGVFESLAYGWDGLPSFFRSARQHMLRFLLLALVFVVIAGIAWGFTAFVFGRIGDYFDDARWPFLSIFIKGAAAWLVLTPAAFLHAASRFRTVRRRAVAFSFRPRWKPLLTCYGYALADPVLTILLAAMLPAMLRGSSAIGVLLWIPLFQVLILAKLVFRLVYELLPDGALGTEFFIAPPGGEFKSYVKGTVKKTGA
jgi:hypothetical protein